MDTILFTHKKPGTPIQGARAASVKTPKGTISKAPKTLKTPRTTKSPKAEPNRKRKLADKSDGKRRGNVDLQVRLKTGSRTSKRIAKESTCKIQVKSSRNFKVKYNFGTKKASAGGNSSHAKRSKT